MITDTSASGCYNVNYSLLDLEMNAVVTNPCIECQILILLDDNDDKAINKYYHVESCSSIYI